MTESESDERPPVTIRIATRKDAATLADLASRLFAEAFSAQNTPEDMQVYLAEAFGEVQQGLELADESTRFWLAEDASGAPVGYAQLKLGYNSEHVESGKQAELARIYADGQFQGKGLGRQLLDTCVAAAKKWGADVLWLGVWEKNPRAISFYEKNGFRGVGDQIFHVGADEQRDLVMARTLAITTP